MVSITKPTEQAFILDPKKADVFLKQDNRQFRKLMEKVERFTTRNYDIPLEKSSEMSLKQKKYKKGR